MSLIKKYKAEVVSVINPVSNIYSVEFRSLSGRFKYLSGQFLHLALDEYDPSFGWPESRCFSMQSGPSSDFIKITFSVKGRFTSRMALELEEGRIVDLKLPYGDLFQQDHSKDNVVFIAGGTGITPFLSLFNDISFSDYKNPRLYLGVRSQKYNIYDQYLTSAIRINANLKIDIQNQDIDGVLDIESIFSKNRQNPTYFISGPQVMITIFKSKLVDLGVDASQIKTDVWE